MNYNPWHNHVVCRSEISTTYRTNRFDRLPEDAFQGRERLGGLLLHHLTLERTEK